MPSSDCSNKQRRRRKEKQKGERKTIWICASLREREDDNLECAWFKLNPEDPKLSGSLVRRAPFPPMPHTLLDDSSFVISGSRIYVLGGDLGRCDYKASADVYFIDSDGTGSYSSSCWIRGPPMLCPRANPTCTVVDGKVYVFGGLGCYYPYQSLPFGEFFDPITNKWEALDQIPPDKEYGDASRAMHFSIAGATVAGGHGKRYIPVHLSTSSSLMGYCLDDNSWFCVDSAFSTFSQNMVLVDDVIYSIHGRFSRNGTHKIAAYHLQTGKPLSVHGGVVKAEDYSTLIYVGNNKFWLYEGGISDCSFVAFKVCKNFKGPALDSISITSVSPGNFRLDAIGFLSIQAA